MPLTLTVNGTERRFETLAEDANLVEVMAALELKADRIAIEHNGAITPRKDWSRIPVRSGDRLEVVHFVGGGAHTSEITLSR